MVETKNKTSRYASVDTELLPKEIRIAMAADHLELVLKGMSFCGANELITAGKISGIYDRFALPQTKERKGHRPSRRQKLCLI